jgi:hypothetical protein
MKIVLRISRTVEHAVRAAAPQVTTVRQFQMSQPFHPKTVLLLLSSPFSPPLPNYVLPKLGKFELEMELSSDSDY